MALSVRQVKTALYRLPDATGTITTGDVAQVLYAFPIPITKSVGGGLTPTGALSRVVVRYRGLDGTLTPTGALARALTLYRELGGTLTPTGTWHHLRHS